MRWSITVSNPSCVRRFDRGCLCDYRVAGLRVLTVGRARGSRGTGCSPYWRGEAPVADTQGKIDFSSRVEVSIGVR